MNFGTLGVILTIIALSVFGFLSYRVFGDSIIGGILGGIVMTIFAGRPIDNSKNPTWLWEQKWSGV